MQPIIHKFVEFQVKLIQQRGEFIISVSDGNEIVDSFIESSEDAQAALKFEQVVYTLHQAKDDDEYRLPLMDFATEDEIQSTGELSYQNHCNHKCKGETKMEIWKDSDGEVAEIYPLDAVADWNGEDEDDDWADDGEDLEDEQELDFEENQDEDEDELVDAYLHDELENEDD